MNTLIVYDSKFGNTERIARAIAEELELAGQAQLSRQLPADLAGIDLLVIGGPTHAHGISAPLRDLLASLPSDLGTGLAVATFDTRYHHARWLTGSAAVGIAKQLQKHGARPVVAPESFFVTASEGPLEPGEIERARSWARSLYDIVLLKTGLREPALAGSHAGP